MQKETKEKHTQSWLSTLNTRFSMLKATASSRMDLIIVKGLTYLCVVLAAIYLLEWLSRAIVAVDSSKTWG